MEAHFVLIIGYLENRLSPQELLCFYDWLDATPEHKTLYFELKAVYDIGKMIRTPTDVHDSWNRLLEKKKLQDQIGRRRIPEGIFRSRNISAYFQHISAYAAVALVAITLTSLFFLLSPTDNIGMAVRFTGSDGLGADVVELPDGTLVRLGMKTVFHFDKDYGKSNRLVYLDGEAYFEVAKQLEKPFIVRTKLQDIEALGTKFNVLAYPADSLLTTTLLEGSVRLTTINKPGTVYLKPNEQLVYNKLTTDMDVRKVDARQFISWTSGYYDFSAQTLNVILHRLSQLYGVEFDLRSKSLGQRTFTGTFYRGQNLDDLLEIISLSLPVKYQIINKRVILSEK